MMIFTFEVETNSKLFEDEQTLYYVLQRVFIQHFEVHSVENCK